MGKILTTVGFERHSKDGELLEYREQPSRSWLKHFFDLWYILAGYNSNTLAGILDISATARTLDKKAWGVQNLAVASPAGNSLHNLAEGGNGSAVFPTVKWLGKDYGIIVGTNNTAVTPTDNTLVARVNNGHAAGELEYGGTEVVLPTFVDPNGAMVIRRYCTNNSGGNITIQECGIYSPGWISNTVVYMFCICRDVVGPAVVVADTEILVVTYTMQITV
jgi:hypothetical protein